MNVIFLTMSRFSGINKRGIYSDLMRKFRDEGHNVYVVAPRERRVGLPMGLVHVNDDVNHNEKWGRVHILGVKTLNLQKTSTVEKGVGQVLVEGQYKRAIKKYFGGVKFDLILYSTPPITFPKVIAYLKKQNPQTVSYLLLKDIFPQNAVDLGMLPASPKPSPQGKGLLSTVMGWVKYQLYRYFRRKEKRLYALSDYIGCMSPANVEYVLKHNPWLIDNVNHNDNLDVDRVEVAPNSVELLDDNLNLNDKDNLKRETIRRKYGLPTDRPVFIYGGNLGKPQGIPFLIECLEANKEREDCHFLVIGTGTELPKLEAWFKGLAENTENKKHQELENLRINPSEFDRLEALNLKPETRHLAVTVMKGLPKDEYDMLVRSCDVGLIFLDHRFTIPNYPSRVLSYMENRMPILCATDPNTDMGRIAEENGYGYWCESNSVEAFTAIVDKMMRADRKAMGENGYRFLKENYTVENTYGAIISHFER